MDIVHLETGRHLYGGARQTVYLIERLAARGIDNLAICAAGGGLAARLRGRARVELVEWPLAGELDWRLGWRLRQLLAAAKPDVLHVHSRRGADRAGGAAATGVPAILTRRVESTEPGFWLRRTLRPYAAVVAISTAVERELVTRAGVDAGRLSLIPSAVDTDRFRPDPAARARLCERFALRPDDCLVAVAAQLIPRKGQAFLLDVIARLAADRPPLRLLLFGRGPNRAKLERQAARLGIGKHVRFCGFVDDWPALVPGLDLLAHPARREGLGSVVLEAMSAGVPVAAAAAGGLVDLIDDGIDGRLLPPDDASVWHEALAALIGNPGDRERLAAAARRKVEQRFTIAAMTDRYLALYRDVTA